MDRRYPWQLGRFYFLRTPAIDFACLEEAAQSKLAKLPPSSWIENCFVASICIALTQTVPLNSEFQIYREYQDFHEVWYRRLVCSLSGGASGGRVVCCRNARGFWGLCWKLASPTPTRTCTTARCGECAPFRAFISGGLAGWVAASLARGLVIDSSHAKFLPRPVVWVCCHAGLSGHLQFASDCTNRLKSCRDMWRFQFHCSFQRVFP